MLRRKRFPDLDGLDQMLQGRLLSPLKLKYYYMASVIEKYWQWAASDRF